MKKSENLGSLNNERDGIMKYFNDKNLISVLLLVLLVSVSGYAKEPYRVGTTAATFLEVGYGGSGCAMGDAAVSSVTDLSGVYWNPARLAYMHQSEAQFMYQPWFADINTGFAAVGLVLPRVGTIALSYIQMDYGEMNVTTTAMQDGTGEKYTANDYAMSLSFGRKLAQWFAAGGSFKYIASNIWHSKASAIAVDLGMSVDTYFFSPSGKESDGLTIGMSISNYGSKMQFEGMDLMQPIDLYPYESGNYQYTEGEFKTLGWELPLIFRIGAAIHPIAAANHRLTLEVDALHPNNNSESLNLGGQYEINQPLFGTLYLRGGYKALFMVDSEYGPSFGAGFRKNFMNNIALQIAYAYRDIGVLGATHAYSLSFLF